MKMIKDYYSVKISRIDDLKCYGFQKIPRHDHEYKYSFVVYRYKKTPLIFVDFILNLEENKIYIYCKDNNDNPYSYNKSEFGKNLLSMVINTKIHKELNNMKIHRINIKIK